VSGPGVLSLSGVRFSYHRDAPAALDDLTLDIPAGTVTAILGPNGAGKTTLLRMMLGVLSPRSGAVRLHGRPLADHSRRELSRQIALVPQAEHVPFALSVLEYVLMGRSPYLGMLEMPGAGDVRIAGAALEELGLGALADRPVPELSAGERQMVLLARAVAQQAQVLLLDEPTSHLDLGNRGRILEILRGLARRGVTAVFTTHDPEAAISAAGWLVLVRGGRTVFAGPLDQGLTSANLTATYGVPVRIEMFGARPVVLPQA
jgi:iron complex transport system ATP-binding protein